MKRIPIILTLISLALLSSCDRTESKLAQENNPQSALATKAVNTAVGAVDGSILLYFNAEPTEQDLAAIAGARSIEKVFPSVPGKEEMEKRFGLDKWYEVFLEEGADITSAAEAAALLPSVQKVEFNTMAVRPEDVTVEGLPEYVAPGPVTKGVYDFFNDPRFNEQWGYINTGNKSICESSYAGGDINVKDVWAQLTMGDPSIIVSVIDEGVKYSHPDLVANIWTNTKEIPGNGIDDDNNGYIDDIHGYNYVAGSNGVISWTAPDDSGHGTHTAGTVAAVNNNGLGVCGVAGGDGSGNGVKIMSGQIFSGKNGASVSGVGRAIKYAADNGASLISCSFGYPAGTFISDGTYKRAAGAEYDALLYFESTKNNAAVDGGIIIFSAGNNSQAYAGYPGALNNVISVSAYGPDFMPSYYTNYGPGCNISAPGGDMMVRGSNRRGAGVLSTLPSEVNNGDDYGFMQGTSMACPHVTGVAALGIAYALKLGKHFTVDEFKTMIVSSAKDIDSRMNGTKILADGKVLQLYNYRHKMGSGGIDAWELMMKIEGIPSIIVATGSEQWVDLSPYFGTCSASLTYRGVEIPDATRQSLGIEGDPYIQYGRLFIHPTKIGSGKVVIHAVGGGDEVGSDAAIGGMAISQEVSIVSRNFKAENGGWL